MRFIATRLGKSENKHSKKFWFRFLSISLWFIVGAKTIMTFTRNNAARKQPILLEERNRIDSEGGNITTAAEQATDGIGVGVSERLITNPTFLTVYITSIVLIAGWGAYRQYYGAWAIDPGGIDSAAPDITLNYLAFGVSSFAHLFSDIAKAVLFWVPRAEASFIARFEIAFLFVLIAIVHSVLYTRSVGSHLIEIAKKWVDPAFLALALFMPLSFYGAITAGYLAGEDAARKEQNAPLNNFYPITFNNAKGERFDFSSGCWLLLKMDKKNIYIFRVTTPELRQAGYTPNRVVRAVSLSDVQELQIFPLQDECPFSNSTLKPLSTPGDS